MKLLLHDRAKQALDQFISHPGHALLIAAPPGTGKATVARYVAGKLLEVEPPALVDHPYFKLIQPPAGKSISISEVRDVIHFLTLRTTGSGEITRVVVFEDADSLTVQAQNALLKSIEEPPAGTVILMTAPSERSLLPTIRSRVQVIRLPAPSSNDTRAYFTDKYSPAAVDKALLMSGGLPGLMHALVEADTSHPLFAATTVARDVLQKSTFERLVLADELAKQRQLWLDSLFILTQMAGTALKLGKGGVTANRRWHKVLSSVHTAQRQTEDNAQLKLVLLNFMLTL